MVRITSIALCALLSAGCTIAAPLRYVALLDIQCMAVAYTLRVQASGSRY
jgi:hypothetical protein